MVLFDEFWCSINHQRDHMMIHVHPLRNVQTHESSNDYGCYDVNRD